mgnify:CR=1 FL=1
MSGELDWYALRDRSPSPRQLSRRQRVILQLVASGAQAREIAELLGITITTVKNHRTIAYQKLEAENAPHAVAIAMRLGWLTADDLDEGARLRGLA